MNAKPPVFEIADLVYRYPDGRVALDGISLAIGAGERVALLGSNGSGKTTLLLNLIGLLVPTGGHVQAFGSRVGSTPAELGRLRSRVGLVFQNPDSQLLSASVTEDVSFGPMNLGLAEHEVRSRVTSALEAVEMAEFAEVPAHALSFGQKKRVCIAGVLAMEPEVLLLDEPTAGLDARAVDDLLAVLARLGESGMTIVMSTHDVDLAYGWADRAEVLESGRLEGSCVADEFAEAFPTFVRHGLARPRVADVWAAAKRAGLVQPDRTAPRTHAQLVAALEDAGAQGAVASLHVPPAEEAS